MAFVYITGITSVPGGIFGGIIYVGGLFAYALLDWFGLQGNWLNLFVGFLVIFSLVSRPEGGATFMFYGKHPSLWPSATKKPERGLLSDGPDAGSDGAAAGSPRVQPVGAEVTG